jgi:hypothetical protein
VEWGTVDLLSEKTASHSSISLDGSISCNEDVGEKLEFSSDPCTSPPLSVCFEQAIGKSVKMIFDSTQPHPHVKL